MKSSSNKALAINKLFLGIFATILFQAPFSFGEGAEGG
jgi:hypothetical protein